MADLVTYLSLFGTAVLSIFAFKFFAERQGRLSVRDLFVIMTVAAIVIAILAVLVTPVIFSQRVS